jgi:MFS family permease
LRDRPTRCPEGRRIWRFGLTLLKDPIPFLIGFGLLAVIVLPYMIYVASTLSVLVPSQLRGRITGLLIMMFSLFGTTLAPTVVASLTDFVFRDPSKLSYSMAIVVGGSLTGALALLRYVLKALAPMLAAPSAVRGENLTQRYPRGA